jgi:hypothetical protein
MNYLDEYADHYDNREYNQPNRKKNSKRRWRDIERIKEQSRLSLELVSDDLLYFEMLEKPQPVFVNH